MKRRIHFELSGEELRELIEVWARDTFALSAIEDVEIKFDDAQVSVEGDVLVPED